MNRFPFHSETPEHPALRVCVIGAGPSGLVASKILKERGISYRCFEKGSDVGGLWRFQNDSGTSAAYESLHINSSRQLMAFADFPMNPSLPDFPHHSHILEYLEDYTAHFGLKSNTTFQTSVTNVVPIPNEQNQMTGKSTTGYKVEFSDRNGKVGTEFFDAVIVANGHHWSPKIPKFEGKFAGEILHSHHYKSSDSFRGKNVLVVGIGNSGVDIACELSRVAKSTLLSTRRGAHIIPKYLLGKPLDRVASKHFWKFCPLWLRQKLFAGLLKITRGRQSRYGMPEPNYKVLQEHPTVSSELLNLLGHGKIKIKKDISSFADDTVRFVDGTAETVDAIILATGYQIKFPFLEDDIMDPSGNEIGLYKNVVHPKSQGLFFTGLVQPWGPLMPLAEAQSEWIADLLQLKAMLPEQNEMEKVIRNDREKIERRYVKSTRHTIQVDFYPYLDQIKSARSQKNGRPALPEFRGSSCLAHVSQLSHSQVGGSNDEQTPCPANPSEMHSCSANPSPDSDSSSQKVA